MPISCFKLKPTFKFWSQLHIACWPWQYPAVYIVYSTSIAKQSSKMYPFNWHKPTVQPRMWTTSVISSAIVNSNSQSLEEQETWRSLFQCSITFVNKLRLARTCAWHYKCHTLPSCHSPCERETYFTYVLLIINELLINVRFWYIGKFIRWKLIERLINTAHKYQVLVIKRKFIYIPHRVHNTF